MADRYDTSGNPEAQYQPGSDNLVLLNELGITKVDDINLIETKLLSDLLVALTQELG